MSRLTPALLAEARKLHAGGWAITEIHRICERRGEKVKLRTLQYHLSGIDREAKARERAAKSGGRLGGGRMRTDAFKLARIQALADEVGLSDEKIARLLAFDGLAELAAHQVRYARITGRYPAGRADQLEREVA